jgi:acyl dehydratase
LTGLTDDALSGPELAAYSLVVEEGDMVRFSTMLGYKQPWFVDPRGARHTRFGGVIGSPTYLIVMRALEHEAMRRAGIGAPAANGVDGGSHWVFFEPIRPGDTIFAVATVAGVEQRNTSRGRTLFQRLEIAFTNQFGAKVATQHDTRIYFP